MLIVGKEYPVNRIPGATITHEDSTHNWVRWPSGGLDLLRTRPLSPGAYAMIAAANPRSPFDQA